jgi:hypothetical protein
MPKLSVLLVMVFFFTTKAHSQTISVSGSVSDTTEKKAVQNAVVALLYAKDSVLYKFVRTDAAGKYSFKNLKAGEYVIMTTHPYFADVVFNLDLKDAETTVPSISLTSKSKLLAEVIIKSGTPIKIKGDTTVYTADSFKVSAGANVEELLKKLPGITVDKDGKITAMGEQVKKVLVDGEEFFGDDPGIATKNLRADIVKEVEVYDKKSDQATFTGIDDGVKDKTINLKLKDNAKKGYFGKAEAGTDFKNYYNNSIMANAFKGKRKLAAYGIMSNTGQTNLDWKDSQNYGGDNNSIVEMDGGGIMITNEGDGDSYYNGRGGIPQNWNGGFHYSNKFNDSKQSINTGYKVTKVNSPGNERNYTTNFTGDSSYNSSSATESFSTKLKQSLNLTFEAKLDSMNTIKFTAKGNLNNTKSNSNYTQQSISDKMLPINNITRRTSSDVDNSSFNSNLLWMHKFKKTARTLTINAGYNFTGSKNQNFLYSENDYFKTGIPESNDTLDQRNKRDNETNSFSANLTYTEPLSKILFLSFTYGYSLAANTNDRASYSKDINGNYNNKIDSLSNSYFFKQINNKPGVSIRLAKKKYNFSVGTSVSVSNFVQDNKTTGLERKYNFTNFFPSASLYVKLKGYAGVRFNYNGSTKVPTLDQLQPVADNTDPLNQYIGNPDLKQSFTHNLNLNYNFYNVLQERGLWAGVYGNFTQNAFVNDRTIYGAAQSTYRTVNANGNYYFGLYSDYNFKLKKPNIRLGFGPNANVSRNISFLNNQKAVNSNSSYGVSLDAGKEKENKYDISINTQITRVNAKNSINTAALANYWQGSINGNVKVTLPYKFRLENNVDFTAKQVDPNFPAKNKFTIWNATLRKFIFKDKLEASASVNDILNERRGYDRSFNEYRYSETYYNTLKRFWMLTLTWNFSKNGKPATGFF